jgi:molybdate transport system permease protein
VTPRREGEAIPPIAAIVAALGAALFVLPLIGLLWRAPWGSLLEALLEPEALMAMRLSLVCSVAATALSVALGLPLAWVQARGRFPGRSLLRALTLLPVVLPPVVGGVALLTVFGRRGLIGQWLDPLGIRLPFTTAGAILAETFVAMPFFVLSMEGVLSNLDRRLEDAARTLGATRWTVFRRVTVPLVRPSVAAGAALCWARALGEFGATITFAGNFPGRTQTIPLAVYIELENRPEAGMALSLVLLAVSLTILIIMRGRWLEQP